MLTRGKPTLGMALTSLMLQEGIQVRVHLVDTAARPVIQRDDVRLALRLASDRKIQCTYDYAGESDRAFSAGKARVIRELDGPWLCLIDDDIVMASHTLRRMHERAALQGEFGYLSPQCVNAPRLESLPSAGSRCGVGSLIYQDGLVRRILSDYYDSTTDVLDQHKTEDKVWEPAFLTALFDLLGRPGIAVPQATIYHLDYQDDPYWIDEEARVLARSVQVARQLVERARANPAASRPTLSPRSLPGIIINHGPGLLARARRTLRFWI